MNNKFDLNVTATEKVCPIGQTYGRQNLVDGNIPVLSCEGACIRGEIARLAANLIVKEAPYKRACHGELITASHSEIAKWVMLSDKVILIDGCFMNCQGRILENLLNEDSLIRFDALSVYKKYTDLMDIDSVPEEERKAVAQQVATAVLAQLKAGAQKPKEQLSTCN